MTRNPEAFYGTLALFDLKNNARRSENFYFDLNRPVTNILHTH
jgi:hypothetical protein